MEYLIDTHVCLWAIADKEKLSEKVKSILEDTQVKIIVSQVSLFEIAIKLKVGKLLEFEVSLPEFIESIYSTGFEILPLKNEHLVAYSNYNFSEQHRDPFDRLLITVSKFEKMPFITKDEKFDLYKEKSEIVW